MGPEYTNSCLEAVSQHSFTYSSISKLTGVQPTTSLAPYLQLGNNGTTLAPIGNHFQTYPATSNLNSQSMGICLSGNDIESGSSGMDPNGFGLSYTRFPPHPAIPDPAYPQLTGTLSTICNDIEPVGNPAYQNPLGENSMYLTMSFAFVISCIYRTT